MEARAHPRLNLRLNTELVCVSSRTCHRRQVQNISMGGLFIAGDACTRPGMEVSVVVAPLYSEVQHSRQLPARVVRTSGSGFAVQFSDLSSKDCRLLKQLMEPEWDGKNVFEGLLIVAAREHVMSLSECLRLTSVICDRYRHLCEAKSCRTKSD